MKFMGYIRDPAKVDTIGKYQNGDFIILTHERNGKVVSYVEIMEHNYQRVIDCLNDEEDLLTVLLYLFSKCGVAVPEEVNLNDSKEKGQ